MPSNSQKKKNCLQKKKLFPKKRFLEPKDFLKIKVRLGQHTSNLVIFQPFSENNIPPQICPKIC